MARLLTQNDAHNIINLLARQMTKQTNLTATDTSSFVSVGETLLTYGRENVLGALSLVLGRTMIASRKYNRNFASINSISTGVFTHRIRKISYYSKDAMASGFFNTNLFTNFANGFDNNSNPDGNGVAQSTKSMWEQMSPYVLEMNFAGSSVWDDGYTTYLDKLEQAFRSEDAFNEFISGIIQEKLNDIETQKEAFSRMLVLNHMAALYDADAILNNSMAINLTKAFNDEYGTSYTTAQLQTTYLKDFLEFFTSFMNILKEDFRDRDTKYHWPVTKTFDGVSHSILRHTPGDRFKGIFAMRFFEKAKAKVFPEVFNEQYLDGGTGYELVNYWQSKEKGKELSINITPAIPDIAGTNNGEQTAGSQVQLDTVLGICFDEDALMVDFQLERSLTSPIEARKGYFNTFWHFAFNHIADLTEKSCLLYMKDEIDDSGSKLSVNTD